MIPKEGQAPFQIATPVTSGGKGNIAVGKRGILEHVDGRQYDARVVQVIENPISMAEALWSPFQRLGSMFTGKIESITTAAEQQFDTASAQTLEAATAGKTAAAAPKPVAPVAVASSATGFVLPVDGTVSRPYNPQAGRNKNDGIDYAAPAGSDVRVASDGVVALVSTSTGGLGTIVLVRHANDILTIYGRVDNVTVAKGDSVRRGQVIGVVAAGNPATMHFEVRKGTESVDPAPYLR